MSQTFGPCATCARGFRRNGLSLRDKEHIQCYKLQSSPYGHIAIKETVEEEAPVGYHPLMVPVDFGCPFWEEKVQEQGTEDPPTPQEEISS